MLQTDDTESNNRIPPFVPTHYTARAVHFFHEGFWDQKGRLTASGEAVMVVSEDPHTGRVKTRRADARYAWFDAEDIYTGPRRDR